MKNVAGAKQEILDLYVLFIGTIVLVLVLAYFFQGREESEGNIATATVVVVIITFAGASLAIGALHSFLKEGKNAPVLKLVNYSAGRFPEIAALAAKHGLNALTDFKYVEKPTFSTLPTGREYWRESFRGPKNEKKFKQFLNPYLTPERTYQYYEPGALAVGQASLALGRTPGFQLYNELPAWDGIDHIRHGQQNALAKKAREREKYIAERNLYLDSLAAIHGNRSFTKTVTENAEAKSIESGRTDWLTDVSRSPLLIFATLVCLWLLAISILRQTINLLAMRLLQSMGAVVFALMTYFRLSHMKEPFYVSSLAGTVAGAVLFTVSFALL